MYQITKVAFERLAELTEGNKMTVAKACRQIVEEMDELNRYVNKHGKGIYPSKLKTEHLENRKV